MRRKIHDLFEAATERFNTRSGGLSAEYILRYAQEHGCELEAGDHEALATMIEAFNKELAKLYGWMASEGLVAEN